MKFLAGSNLLLLNRVPPPPKKEMSQIEFNSKQNEVKAGRKKQNKTGTPRHVAAIGKINQTTTFSENIEETSSTETQKKGNKKNT